MAAWVARAGPLPLRSSALNVSSGCDFSQRILKRRPCRVDLRRNPTESGAFVDQVVHGVEGVREGIFRLPPPDEGPVYIAADSSEEEALAADVLARAGWQVEKEIRGVESTADDSFCSRLPASCQKVTWRPNSFLENVVLLDLLPKNQLPDKGVAIDFGCGSGRDAVFLAQVLPSAWTVVAIDNHQGALDRTQQLARAAGVSVDTCCIDLRRRDSDYLLEHVGKVDLAHGARFMEKNLLADLRDRILRRPDGVIIWSTFVGAAQHEPETNLAPPFRHTRRWEHGEAARLFSPPQFEILHDLQGEMATRGVKNPATFFAARVRH